MKDLNERWVRWIIKFLRRTKSNETIFTNAFLFTAALFSKDKFIRHYDKHLKRLFAEYFRFTYHPRAAEMTEKILDWYMPNKPLNESFYEISRVRRLKRTFT